MRAVHCVQLLEYAGHGRVVGALGAFRMAFAGVNNAGLEGGKRLVNVGGVGHGGLLVLSI